MARRGGGVPVGQRLLAARPVHTIAGALGIGLALMLMLLLDGLWAGVQERVTSYEDHLDAELVVVQPSADTLFADPGVLPAAWVAMVGTTEGVRSVAPVRTMYLILELDHGKAAVAVAASDPGRPGGPWQLASGRPPGAGDEVVVDRLFADQHDLSLGDVLPMLGHRMRIVGLADDTAMFMTPLVFTTHDALSGMLRSRDTVGGILVGADNPSVVAERLRRQGLTVRTPAQLAEESLVLATRIYGVPVRLMVAVSFAAGTLIAALVAYTRIAQQQRDLGILKALGATPRRIRRIAVTETMVLTMLGVVASVALMLVVRELLAWWRPAFPVALSPAGLLRTAAAAVAMALLAAWLPARRLARLDAASAFRSRS